MCGCWALAGCLAGRLLLHSLLLRWRGALAGRRAARLAWFVAAQPAPTPATNRHNNPTGPKFVEWINDSSANILFADGPTAKRAVAGRGRPLPPEEAPEQLGAPRHGRPRACAVRTAPPAVHPAGPPADAYRLCAARSAPPACLHATDDLQPAQPCADAAHPTPPTPAKPAGIDPADPASIAYLWHKGEDFPKAGTAIPLIFRIATVEDVRPADRVPSRRLWLTAGGGARGGGQQAPRGGRPRGGEGEGGGEGEEGTAPRGRGRRRYKVRRGGRPAGWQHDDRGEAEEGAGGEGQQEWGDLEAVIQQQRRGSGGGGGRRGRGGGSGKRRRGDIDMADAEGGQVRGRRSVLSR